MIEERHTERYTITLGASTTAGGTVTAASSSGSINGVAVALENDPIFCPACKSQGKILCIGPRLPETWNGKQVALEKDLCLCGCFPSPRLIASQSLRCQSMQEDGSATESLAAATMSPVPLPGTPPKDGEYDLDFTVSDEKTGMPLVDWPYIIELASGASLAGKTDAAGKTAKVAAPFAEHAVLRVYAPEPAPIIPLWDR